MNRTVRIHRLGVTDYQAAWDYQKTLFENIVALKLQNRTNGTDIPTDNHLLLTEHPPVYTLGRHGDPAHLLLSEEKLRAAGASFYRIDRGGDITFHGPGQLVAYPILDLDNFSPDIHLYVHRLEETVIRTLACFGVETGRIEGRSGVWIDPTRSDARKICAVGVKTSRWVTMHGLALNVNTDLSFFRNIVPCGISDKGVTSLARETGHTIEMESVIGVFLEYFAQIFGCSLPPCEIAGSSPAK